jgi:hypothetical protein
MIIEGQRHTGPKERNSLKPLLRITALVGSFNTTYRRMIRRHTQSDAEFLIHKMFELRTLLFYVLNLWEFIAQIKRIKYI